jgi:putative phosphonate metabolism protein
MAERYAIYYAPSATSALWERASAWLGRDAKTGEDVEGPVAGLERARLLNFTGAPSRYGFHATLRAPFRLRPEIEEARLVAECAALAARLEPVKLTNLRVGIVEGFLALICEPDPALTALAQAVVEASEPLRAPLSEKEMARRLKAPLSERQIELLNAYGYPYVAEQFLFHMTLSEKLAPEATAEIVRAAETWFAPVLEDAAVLDRLVLYVEPDPERDFRRLDDFVLGGGGT